MQNMQPAAVHLEKLQKSMQNLPAESPPASDQWSAPSHSRTHSQVKGSVRGGRPDFHAEGCASQHHNPTLICWLRCIVGWIISSVSPPKVVFISLKLWIEETAASVYVVTMGGFIEPYHRWSSSFSGNRRVSSDKWHKTTDCQLSQVKPRATGNNSYFSVTSAHQCLCYCPVLLAVS